MSLRFVLFVLMLGQVLSLDDLPNELNVDAFNFGALANLRCAKLEDDGLVPIKSLRIDQMRILHPTAGIGTWHVCAW